MTESQIRHDERERCAKMLDVEARDLMHKADRYENGVEVNSREVARMDAARNALSSAAHMLRQIPAAEDIFDHILLEERNGLVLLDCVICLDVTHFAMRDAADILGIRSFIENHSDCQPMQRTDKHIPVTRWLAEHGEKEESK